METISAWATHALAGRWSVLGPVHQGVPVTSSMPGEPAGEVTWHTATLVQVNGLWVLRLLFILPGEPPTDRARTFCSTTLSNDFEREFPMERALGDT